MDKSQKTELIAPDGGYGYVILVAVMINLSIYNVYLNCYALIFKDFFAELSMDSRDITVLAGFSAMWSSIAGFSAAPILKMLSIRKTALLAAAFYNCGLICTVFANSKTIFYIFQGVCQNIGNGLLYNISNTILNEYFVKNRFLAISISSTAVALVCFIAPQLLHLSSEIYGHRGALICLCAVSVHIFAACTLMHPVSWHMKKIVHTETEMKLLSKDCGETQIPIKEESNVIEIKQNTILTGDLDDKKDRGILCRIKNLLDLELIKSFTLSIECLGTSVCLITDLTYLYMLPQALQSYGWSDANVAWAFSLLALGDLIMRVFLILLNKWLNKIGSAKIYVAGISVAFFARLGIAMSSSVSVTFALLTIVGATRCIVLILLVLVVSESVNTDKFSSAIGIVMLMGGLENLTIAPVIGAIRDYTQSYSIAMNAMTGIFGVTSTIWLGKFIFCRQSSNKKQNVT